MPVHSVHGSQSSQPASLASVSSPQQQNLRFSHQPVAQWPILTSESHSVTMEMRAALTPMAAPAPCQHSEQV